MIDPTHELPIVRQAQLLDLSRSSVYYLPQATPEAELALMRRIDELHLEHPFAGARMLRDLLRRDGHAIGRKHVATLMRRMGIEALYQKANTSRRHPAHPVYPYLLRGLAIDTPNQVWAMDTTYSTPSQRSPPAWGWSCLSMFGMQGSAKLMLQYRACPFSATRGSEPKRR